MWCNEVNINVNVKSYNVYGADPKNTEQLLPIKIITGWMGKEIGVALV